MNNRTKGIIAILLSAFGFALMNLFIPLAGCLLYTSDAADDVYQV